MLTPVTFDPVRDHVTDLGAGAGVGDVGGYEFPVQTLVVQAGVRIVLPGASSLLCRQAYTL